MLRLGDSYTLRSIADVAMTREFFEDLIAAVTAEMRQGKSLQEMEKKLEALGASKGKWRPPGHGPAGSEKSANWRTDPRTPN